MNINNTMFPLSSSWSGISRLQDQFDNLQQQLATGKKASTLADMGSVRFTDLTVRAKLGRLTGYDSNINTVNLRLNTMNQVLTSLGTINTTARSASTVGAYGTGNVNLATAPQTAQQQLDQVVTSLNTDLNGHYLFGGGVTEQAPVASYDTMMNGSGLLAGFKTVAAQRLQADQGADGLGRLTLSTTSDTTTLSEDGAHPFGFKLASVTSSNPAVTLTQPTGSPAALSVQVATQPAAGDTVTIGLNLPDGTTDSISMKAVTGTPANPGEFQIGATTADTATNFQAALQSSLQTEGSTKLAVASNYEVANNFFNGQGGSTQRVAIDTTSNSYYAATGYETAAQTASDTVQWYQGGDSNGSARTSVTTKVDDNTTVSYGVEANESGFVKLVRSLAVQAIQTYPTTDDATTATSQAKFNAVAAGQISNLSALNDSVPGSITSIGVDLGLAQSTLKSLSDQHTAYSSQLQDILSKAETADTATISASLVEIQTRLSASYSVTSMLSQLQLTNYLK
ncbi:MAG: hypothetical protein P4M09_09675 [Devosia sp.]|nr:hypothetical protein [Devosia sp.]